jgi:RND family efflux transporter MFP subunit
MIKKFWIGSSVIIVLAAVGFWALGGGRLSGADAPPAEASYRTMGVERRNIGSTVLATGVIRPRVGAEVQVGSRVSGILKELHVTIGDQVPPGFLLAVLDPTEFEARRNQAVAQLETAIAERDFAALELSRTDQMLREEVTTQAEFDSAERSFNMAAAQVRQAEAALESAEIQLGYTRIWAPFGGVGGSVSTHGGVTVAASFASPTFVTIIDLDRLEVWAYVDETDIGRVEAGQRATFTVDTYLDTEFSGVVTAIQPAAEIVDNVVNYVTLVEIGPTNGKTLRPEMTTSVNIVLEGRENVLSLPNGAVRRDADGAFAFIPGTIGPERRTIKTGYRGSDFTEVLEGLEEGDAVVVGSVATSN